MIASIKSSFIFFSLIILSSGMESCGSAHNSKEPQFENIPPFVIAEAYFQNWVGGIKEAGSGANIHIGFTSINPEVTIENIYFRNEILKTTASLENPLEYVGYLIDSSESDYVMDIDPIKEARNTPIKDFPFKLDKNEAVIGYNFQGRKEYYKIPNLSEKKEIAYPQSNRNP